MLLVSETYYQEAKITIPGLQNKSTSTWQRNVNGTHKAIFGAKAKTKSKKPFSLPVWRRRYVALHCVALADALLEFS